MVISGWWLVVGGWLLATTAFAADTRTRTEIIDPVATGEIRLRPTFCSCGICFGVASGDEELAIQYRKVGDSAWLTETRFPFFDDVNNCRGSIMGLDEDTEYEVKVVGEGEGGVKAQGTFRTWASEVPIAETIVLDGNTAFPVVVDRKGTADGWIRYTAAPGFVLDNGTEKEITFKVNGAEYVVFDNLTIKGSGARYVFQLTNSKSVRIRNCEMTRWGRVGVPRYDFNTGNDGKRYLTKNGTSSINFDPAVYIGAGCNSVVVERCFIHDPRGRSCSWYYSHPAGPEAVFMVRPDHSTVLRYNDFVGSDSHRWNDAVEGEGNFYNDGGFNREADVYGNYMSYCDDDCIELDGGMQNVRCFNNRFENALCGVSVQGCMVSPTYVCNNLFSGMCEEQALSGQTIKTDDSATQPNGVSNSVVYVSGNIMMKRGSGMSMRPSLIAKVTDNAIYDSQKIGEASDGHVGSVNENNENRGASSDATADGNYPYRPLGFTLDRSLISGVSITDGRVCYPQAGALDIGAAVFRYEGNAATNRRPVISTAPVIGSTNSPAVYDLRGNLTFASSFSTGPLPFVKTGAGDMIFDGGLSCAYNFLDGQPSTKMSIPYATYYAQFVLPEDGSLPTSGFHALTLLEGRIVLNSGTLTMNPATSYIAIGGWTAGQDGCENDVSMVVNGGYFTASAPTTIGMLHGFANFNTSSDKPALAELVINGGTFCQSMGRVMYLGAYNGAPTGKSYNTLVRIVVNEGGVFTHSGSYSGTDIRQRKGQVAQLKVDGGTYIERNLNIGSCVSANDTSATVDIEVINGGVMEGEHFTNNVKSVVNPPPVRVSVRDGGKLLYDSIGNNGSSQNFTLSVDGGTVGTRNISSNITSPEKNLIGPNVIVEVGAKGMTVETSGSVGDTPLTAVISSPITSGVTNGKDGGVNFVTGEGNVIRLKANVTCSGPVTASGSGSVEFADGAQLVYDIPADETQTVSIGIAGDYTILKRGLGHLVIAAIDSGYTGKFKVEEGTIGFANGTTANYPYVFNGGGVKIPADEQITLAGAISGASMAVEGEGGVVLGNPANSIARLVLDTANVICGAANVCTNAVLEYKGSVLQDGVGYFDLNGHDQLVFDIFTPELPKDVGGCQLTNSSATSAVLQYSPLVATNCYVKLDGKLNLLYCRVPVSADCKARLRNRRHTMSGAITFKRNGLTLDEGTAFPRLTSIGNSNYTRMDINSTEPDLFVDLNTLDFGSTKFYLNTPEAVEAINRCRPKLKTGHASNSLLYIGDGLELNVANWYAVQSAGKGYMAMGAYNAKGTDGAYADAKVATGTLLVWSGNSSGTRPTHSNLVWNSTASASIANAANWTYEGEFPTFRVPMAAVEFAAVGTAAQVDSRAIWGGIKFTASATDFTLQNAGGSLAIVDDGIVVEAGSTPRAFTIAAPIDNCGEALNVAIPAGEKVVLSDALTNISQIALSGAGTLTIKTEPVLDKLSVASLLSVAGGVARVDARTANRLVLTSSDRLNIPAGVEIVVRALTLDGNPVADGAYDKSSPELSGVLTGDGTLTVMRRGTYLYFQ